MLAAAAAKRVTLYDLRHTFAILSIAAGVEPKKVSHDLGHASVAFTLDVYCHMVEEMHDQASGKLEGVLFPEKGAKAG